jgi:hypothetical protein
MARGFNFFKRFKNLFKPKSAKNIKIDEDSNDNQEFKTGYIQGLKNDYIMFKGLDEEFDNMSFSFKKDRRKYPILKIIKKPKKNKKAKEIYKNFSELYNKATFKILNEYNRE